MSPYISGFLIFLIISLFLGAFFSLLNTDKLKLNDESLEKQLLFWFAILSPIVLFLIVGGFVWKNYIPDLSEEGISKFAEISFFPLAILALSPIFGVIVSNIHKSIQTEKQILVSESKNRSDSFYAHYKFITEELERIKFRIEFPDGEIVLKNVSTRYLYNRFFRNANHKNGAPDEADPDANWFLSDIFHSFSCQYIDEELLGDLSAGYHKIRAQVMRSTYTDSEEKIKRLFISVLNELNFDSTIFESKLNKLENKLMIEILAKIQPLIMDIFSIVGIKDSDFHKEMLIACRIAYWELKKA
ncbi:hypothetical protein [Providencia sp. wls1914]|uniref:hypothetical protein n=1 Tax=Providencia sp. wls1914 TaxID=2675156 RepID=UPI0012B51CB6|nr:hypothetical protein [Providencia sp. wls1914]MTC71146.1 hypothetical protein [Providencia sp. wls1914]